MGRSPFNNVRRVVVDGVKYDSTTEARHFQQLKLMELAGQIVNLQQKVRLTLGRDYKGRMLHYKPDFTYWRLSDGAQVVEEVKGHIATEAWKMRHALAEALYPTLVFRVVKYEPGEVQAFERGVRVEPWRY